MIKNATLALTCLAMLSLTACENVQKDMNTSFGQSANALQQAFSNLKGITPSQQTQVAAQSTPGTEADAARNSAPIIATSGPSTFSTTGPNCPNVRIVGDLNQVHQFVENAPPARANEISVVQMQGVDTKCKVTNGSISIDMNIAFTGEVGPKGRARKADKPSFAYPYFIAITNNQGSIIGKEVFALSMNYDSADNTQTRTEQVRQMIPMRDKDYRNYKVMIGFQLNDQELAYNRALPPQYMSPSNPLGEIAPAAGGTIDSPVGNE